MENHFKRGFTRTTAVLFAALLLSTSAYVPQSVVPFVSTGIVANAVATTVSDDSSFLTAIANGGEIVLGADITLTQAVTISQACTIDFNGKTITFGGSRDDKFNLTVNAPTTLKNGTLTSSCTNDPRFPVLSVSSDTAVENMTISQPGNNGGWEIVNVSASKLTMTDSTITYISNGGATAKGIDAENNATLLFYGNNTINTVDGNKYDWNIIQDCDCYFYPGTLEINYHFAAYNSSSTVYFCGGTVKNTRSGDKAFSGLSADKVIVAEDYELYSDEDCTVPMTAEEAVSASAIYTKKKVQCDISDTTITVGDQFYTGEAIEPTITVKNGDDTLTENTDYTVEYADNTDIGTATVTVTGIGDCVGEQEVEFDIAASLTAPADANVVVYKSKTTVADKINGKDAVKEGYYIVYSIIDI